jgi:hypothetical protein
MLLTAHPPSVEEDFFIFSRKVRSDALQRGSDGAQAPDYELEGLKGGQVTGKKGGQ